MINKRGACIPFCVDIDHDGRPQARSAGVANARLASCGTRSSHSSLVSKLHKMYIYGYLHSIIENQCMSLLTYSFQWVFCCSLVDQVLILVAPTCRFGLRRGRRRELR